MLSSGAMTAWIPWDFKNCGTLTVISFMCMPHPMVKKDACGATATAKVKRSDFNMGKYAPLVGDEVTLTIPVESIKQ